MPRSGTTWLGKIFDSHPDVIYRHEPDSVIKTDAFSYLVSEQDVAMHLKTAHDYLYALTCVNNIKVSGVLPNFPKNFHSPTTSAFRKKIIYGLKISERLPLLRQVIQTIPIPDCIPVSLTKKPTTVIKSVISMGRAKLFSESLNDGHIIMIIRHPCGYVASQFRGKRLGKLEEGQLPLKVMASTDQAKQWGLSRENLKRMSKVEQLTWHWNIFNDKALLETRSNANFHLLRYEDLCIDTLYFSKQLFASCQLEWSSQTEEYIAISTQASSSNSYFGLQRNSAQDVEKWRNELDSATIEIIHNIAMQSESGQLYGTRTK